MTSETCDEEGTGTRRDADGLWLLSLWLGRAGQTCEEKGGPVKRTRE